MPVTGGAGILPAVAGRLADAGLGVSELALRRPTLEEAFLALTGQPASGPAGQARPAPSARSAR
jgi:ABC-2 type transport system ATP-binding protein